MTRPDLRQDIVTPLGRVLRDARAGFLLIAIFSLFLNLLMLVSPIYMMQVFDRVLSSGRTETLLFLTLIACFALTVMGALETVRASILARIGTWIDRQLGATLVTTSVASRLAGKPTGAQPLRDLAQIRGFLGGAGIAPLFDVPWMPVFLAIIFAMSPWLGLLALGSAVFLFALALLNDAVTRKPLRQANQVAIGANTRAESTIRNADVVQAMGMLPALLDRWERENETVLALQTQAGDRGNAIVGCSKFARMFVQIAILGLGAYLVLQNELTSGGMIAASILLGRALAPVEQAIGAWRGFVAARTAYDRLQRLLRSFPAKPQGMRLPAPRGDLLADRIVFTPPGSQKPVLKQVSFELKAGESLGLIGPSAAGKSTLCRLLVGSWPPTSGHVRLDNADVTAWDRTEFGRHVGYLPQDVELFAGTVRDNIARMGDAAPDAVVEAAKLAGVHDMILHLPSGYDTEIGESGAVLSGGQRQRIGLARALFGRPRLLVLDEPNASLDQEGEAALLEAIGAMKQDGATVVLVSHRPSLVSRVDKLLVLRDGAVELFGQRDQVMARLTAPRRPAPVPPQPQPQPALAVHQG